MSRWSLLIVKQASKERQLGCEETLELDELRSLGTSGGIDSGFFLDGADENATDGSEESGDVTVGVRFLLDNDGGVS
jgi:hypothetical protein